MVEVPPRGVLTPSLGCVRCGPLAGPPAAGRSGRLPHTAMNVSGSPLLAARGTAHHRVGNSSRFARDADWRGGALIPIVPRQEKREYWRRRPGTFDGFSRARAAYRGHRLDRSGALSGNVVESVRHLPPSKVY